MRNPKREQCQGQMTVSPSRLQFSSGLEKWLQVAAMAWTSPSLVRLNTVLKSLGNLG